MIFDLEKNISNNNFFKLFISKPIFFFAILSLFIISPNRAEAGFFSFLAGANEADAATSQEIESSDLNSQNMPILKVTPSFKTGTDSLPEAIPLVSGSAILAESGPSGTLADIGDKESNTLISIYVVRKGDTLGKIANIFGVSVNTILWANNMEKNAPLKDGQTLVILPTSGVKHIVKKGETLLSIVSKYKADLREVMDYNEILTSSTTLSIGRELIIPDAEIAISSNTSYAPDGTKLTAPLHGADGPYLKGYFIRPITGGVRTQGLHGYNAVDLASTLNTPIYASARGTVIIASSGGWNRGYGNYIVIAHPNGTQTVYAHANKLLVSVGDKVEQGDKIALMGTTGHSTGVHLHFEIRGAKNPF